jgi:aspartate aminotransferase-like enzyme
MVGHRSAGFKAFYEQMVPKLRAVLRTAGDATVATGSSTLIMESAVVSCVAADVLNLTNGAFSARWHSISKAVGKSADQISAPWGEAIDPDLVRAALSRKRYDAVTVVHNETSTGVMNPIPVLAAAIREVDENALILVDSVSALGAVPFEMDRWGIDIVVTGSQKAWMAAPGLAMVAASERAWAAMETATMPRFYLDLHAHRESHTKGQTPWTPALAVVFQVDEGLELMEQEGAAAVFARHEACAAAARAGLQELGFELFADQRFASPTVTAARVPEGLDWKGFNAAVKERGVSLAGGQGKIAGHVFRLGHLGSVTLGEILDAIGVLEEVSIAHDRSVDAGAAVAAAQRAALEAIGSLAAVRA